MEAMVETAEPAEITEEAAAAVETAAEPESPGGEPIPAESVEQAPSEPERYRDLPMRMERQIARTVRLERELQRANRQLREFRMANELRSLQAHDPAANLTSIAERGDDYVRLRKAGVSATSAYEAVKYRRAKSEIPPDTGALGSDRAQEKEFYTPDEVDRLSSRELDDPKIMERVMRSMTKWKK